MDNDEQTILRGIRFRQREIREEEFQSVDLLRFNKGAQISYIHGRIFSLNGEMKVWKQVEIDLQEMIGYSSGMTTMREIEPVQTYINDGIDASMAIIGWRLKALEESLGNFEPMEQSK